MYRIGRPLIGPDPPGRLAAARRPRTLRPNRRKSRRVKAIAGDEGFNAETGQYENPMQASVIDRMKVVGVPNCTDATSTIFYRS